jgi:hypothetical protein
MGRLKTELDRRRNRREMDRLRLSISEGRGNGATVAALDRRQAADLDYFRRKRTGDIA